jgi:hypothetical protein
MTDGVGQAAGLDQGVEFGGRRFGGGQGAAVARQRRLSGVELL